MTNSTKHTFSSDAGIALYSGAIVGADMDVAMQIPCARHILAERTRPQPIGKQPLRNLKVWAALAGFSQ
jgi:hypothetical protein